MIINSCGLGIIPLKIRNFNENSHYCSQPENREAGDSNENLLKTDIIYQ